MGGGRVRTFASVWHGRSNANVRRCAMSNMLCDGGVPPRLRLRAIRMLVDITHLGWADAQLVDRGMVRFCDDEDTYVAAAKRLCHNLHYNEGVAERYPLADLASLTHEQLCGPVLERFQRAEIERSEAISNMLKQKYDDVNATAVRTSVLKCRSCGSSDVNWAQKQTRGADESMTIFCTCVCGNRWKMS